MSLLIESLTIKTSELANPGTSFRSFSKAYARATFFEQVFHNTILDDDPLVLGFAYLDDEECIRKGSHYCGASHIARAVITVIFAAFLIGEELTPFVLGRGLLIFIGVFLITVRRRISFSQRI
jgi:hypothetical protein